MPRLVWYGNLYLKIKRKTINNENQVYLSHYKTIFLSMELETIKQFTYTKYNINKLIKIKANVNIIQQYKWNFQIV